MGVAGWQKGAHERGQRVCTGWLGVGAWVKLPDPRGALGVVVCGMVEPVGFNKLKALGDEQLTVKLVLCRGWGERDMSSVSVCIWLVFRFGWLWGKSH